MKWEKTSSSEWKAAGIIGTFFIKKSCGKFWACFISAAKAFKMPPKDKLKSAKSMCEDSYYWEEA